MNLPLARIKAVRFSLAGDEENREDAVVDVQRQELYQNGRPFDYGLYDLRMGTTRYDLTCKTCLNNKTSCLGHFGLINLNARVNSSLFYAYIIRWLKEICHECGSPIADLDKMSHIPPELRFKYVKNKYVYREEGRIICKNCKTIQPNVIFDKEHRMPLINMRDRRKKIRESSAEEMKMQILLPDDIYEIFSRVENETVEKFGMSIKSHPRKLIIKQMRVAPNTIRPENRVSSLQRSVGNEITIALQGIIKENNKIPSVMPEEIGNVLENNILDLNGWNFVMTTMPKKTNNPEAARFKSMATRVTGKDGRLRKNLLGKRINFTCRSIISGDPKLKLNQVGIPVKFAKIIQIDETLQEYNRERLMVYFTNGRKKYPGCTKITKRNGESFIIESSQDNINFENGDTISRDLVDGDYFIFNRQPSLMSSNMTSMEVVIISDPNVHTLLMNVIVCPLYAADFDGDAMNGFFVPSVGSRSEIAELSSPKSMIIKHGPSSLLIGTVDDSIVGSAILSMATEINRYTAALLFATTTFLPDLAQQEVYTGRDIYSLILQNEGQITYRGKPSIYNQAYDKYFKYKKEDTNIVIDNGKVISGVFDKKSVGKSGVNNLFHIIYQEKGAENLLNIMFNFQQVAINYAYFAGFTLGLTDMIMPRESLKEVHRLVEKTKQKSALITKQLDERRLIPPMGKTIEEFYEELQMEELNFGDTFMDVLLGQFNIDNNNLLKMALTGSKGSINHMAHVMCAVGQIKVGGKRPAKQLSHRRTLAYFHRYDTAPEANGFIPDSYVNGISKSASVFAAQEARLNFFNKSLSTAKTGHVERKSVKGLENITVDNQFNCVKCDKIVQHGYGGNCLDTRKVISTSFPTITISDQKLEDGWHFRASEPKFQAIFDAEFEQIKADRGAFRSSFSGLQKVNYSEMLSGKVYVSIDIHRSLEDAIVTFGGSSPSEVEIVDMVKMVQNFSADLVYTFTNESVKKARLRLPKYLEDAIRPLQILTRSELNSKRCLSKINKDILQYLFDKITKAQRNALVDYGNPVGILAATSYSEPVTQEMLKSTHGSVSGRGVQKSLLQEIKETFGTTDVSKMSSAIMTLRLLPEYEADKNIAYRISSMIEEVKVSHLARSPCHIFYEKFREPIHPKFKHERAMIEEFITLNPIYKPPTNLSNWCVRFEFLRNKLIYKNISLLDIIAQIRDNFPLLYIVHSSENAPVIVVRIYLRLNTFSKKSEDEEMIVTKVANDIIKFTVRGVDRILTAEPVEINVSDYKGDGSIGMRKVWAIRTVGINLYGVAKYVPEIDIDRIYSDSAVEVQEIYGIAMAQALLGNKVMNMGSGILYSHASVYSSVMVYTGEVTTIEKKGLNIREPNDILLRMAFSSPIESLTEASIRNISNPIDSVSSSLIMGAVPDKIGTVYNKVMLDEEMLRENIVDVNKYIEELGLDD